MKIKLLAISSGLTVLLLGSILPRAAYAFSLVPDKCIQSKTGCNACDIVLIFTNISNIIAGFLAGTALLNFVIAGLVLILSNGNEQRIESAKKNLQATIIGLIVVMFAWISVNYVVRLAYKANLGTGTDAKIFGKDWWAPSCTTGVNSCSGAFVGDSCTAVGDCKTNNGSDCTCFRNLKTSGDFGECGTPDAANADDAAKNYTNCYCASQCSQLNYRPNYTTRKWSCKPKSKAKSDKTLDTVTAASVPCASPDDICVGAK